MPCKAFTLPAPVSTKRCLLDAQGDALIQSGHVIQCLLGPLELHFSPSLRMASSWGMPRPPFRASHSRALIGQEFGRGIEILRTKTSCFFSRLETGSMKMQCDGSGCPSVPSVPPQFPLSSPSVPPTQVPAVALLPVFQVGVDHPVDQF